MDIQEKKAFEIAFENKLGARGCQFDLDEDGNYEDRETLCGWHMWLEAKAQAVLEGFAVVPIEITPKQIEAYMKGKVFPASMGEHRKFVERLSKDYKAMIAAGQEPANADTNS